MCASGGFAGRGRSGPAAGAVALLLGLGLGLAACSDGESAAVPQTPTAMTVTHSTPPNATVRPPGSPSPTLSAEARQPTQAGAVAFIYYYFDAYEDAFWTADPTLLESISDPHCVFCSSAVTAVRGMRAQGERAIGGKITVVAAAVAPNSPPDRTVLAVRLDQEAARTISGSGAVDSSSEAHRDRMLDVAVRWIVDHWVLLAAAAPPASPS